MSDNNEKEKPKSITYIKNEKYSFNIIKIISHSPTNIEKIGITIHKKTLEINILNKDCIDLFLNTNSNSKFVESYANIGFINLYGIVCFIYVLNNDIKEKGKITLSNNKPPYKIYRIDNIRFFVVSYYIPPKLKKFVKGELEKIRKFFVEEQLFFTNCPYRYDFDMSNQLKVFEDNNYKYKLYEIFRYNEDFSLKINDNFLTPIVKGFYKHISYNNVFNDKDCVNVSIRYNITGKNKYLIEVEMFITPNTNQKYFQNTFYAYFNESNDKILHLKDILDKWNNNNSTPFKKGGVIINYCCNKKEEKKNNEFIEEIQKLKVFNLVNINHSKIEDIENILNLNIETLKSVGYNYKYNNIDYNSQNKLLIIIGNDYDLLFSFLKVVAFKMYGIFLIDRGIQKNIINNAKEEIFKRFKKFEKKIKHLKNKFPHRLNVEFIKNESELKDNFKYDENKDIKASFNFHINNKDFIMVDSEKNDNKDFVIVDTLANLHNNNDNEKEKKIEDKTNNEEDNNINDNCIIEEYNNEINNNIEENYTNSYENKNLDDNINENHHNLINDDINENKNNNNDINKEIINNDIINPDIINKKFKITIFIGTFNVNALESDLIKKINLDLFLFPEKIKNYFSPENIPTFYCIGLEETIELNPKNVLIKPKNKAELWEERISEELKKKFNYFLLCKEQLVGVLLLFFVKATELQYISNIHIEKLKSGFMGCGNKGCCFFDFNYKKYSYGFCSCHLPAGQNKKNYLDRKEVFRQILDFNVNKNINEFYKNDFFFIFGDLNFRTQKIGLIDLQNHIKIIMGESKYNKDGKKKKNFRFSLEFTKKHKNKDKDKDKEIHKDKNRRKNTKSDNLSDIQIPDNIENDKNIESNKNIKKEKEINYDNFNSNKVNEIKQCNMDENTFIQYFFKDFLKDEELKKLKEQELLKYNLDEAEITFPPTYKYVKGTNFYNINKRVPSWTDRIIYKNGEEITPIFYDRIYINFSDHKPLVGLFGINVEE